MKKYLPFLVLFFSVFSFCNFASASVLYDNSRIGQAFTGGVSALNLSNTSSSDYTTARSDCSSGGGYAGGTILLSDVKFIRVKILSGTIPTNMQIGGHTGTGNDDCTGYTYGTQYYGGPYINVGGVFTIILFQLATHTLMPLV
jgi:hypothetical protein